MRTIGPYEIHAELGRGGMGVVYRGWDPALSRPVAVKVLLVGAAAGHSAQATRFQREVQAAARLRHPHIVAVHAAGAAAGQLYLAMDLLEGGSLADRLRQGGPLEPVEAARTAALLASALHYAHGQGVLHRDVKPANVLFDASGAPALSDFGLAKLGDAGEALTRTGDVLGTPGYMAPEQASGDPRLVGPACDVYGAGATLYALLCGEPPFHAASALATLRAVLEDPVLPPSRARPGVPAELEAICLRALEKDPAARFSDAGAFAAALEGWLEHAGPGRAKGTRRPHERRPAPLVRTSARTPVRTPGRAVARTLAGALAGAGLAVGGLLGWLLASAARSDPGVRAADQGAVAREGEREERLRAAQAELAGRAQELARVRAERDGLRQEHEELRLRQGELEEHAQRPGAALERLLAQPRADPGALDDAIQRLGAQLHTFYRERAAERRARGDRYGATRDLERALAHLAATSLPLEAAIGLHLELADDHHEAGRFAEGAASATFAVEAALASGAARHEPHLILGLVRRAQCRVASGDVEGALADAALLLERDPSDFWGLRTRGEALHRAGRTDAAAEAMQRALALRPDDADLPLLLADVLLDAAGDHDALAADLLRRAAASSPSAAVDVRRARLHARAGRLEAARDLLEGALDDTSGWGVEALLLLGRAQEARDRLKERTERERHLTDDLLREARARTALGNHAAASRVVRLALARNPTRPDALVLQARVLFDTGSREAARVAAERAARLSPGYVPATLVLARLTAEAGQRELATTLVEQALASDPRSAEAYVLRGWMRWMGTDFEGARRDLGEAQARVLPGAPYAGFVEVLRGQLDR